MRLNLADAYSNDQEDSEEYKEKLAKDIILPNACEPLKGVMEATISGIEITVLTTSYANMAVALCLHRFCVIDTQDEHLDGKLVNLVAAPYRKIISSP